MKKSVLALAMAFGVTSAFAQDLTSKKGEPILPEAGDWAISADATPFLNYLGKAFSGSNSAPTMNFLGNNSVIMGKYFKDEKTAYRVGLNIGFNSQSASNLVNQDQQVVAAGAAPVKVTDKTSVGTTGIGLTAGIEKRKGKTRLQGYYGAEAGIYLGSQHQKNTYGNSFAGTGTAAGTDVTPTSTTWGTGSTSVSSTGAVSSRTTDWKSGTTFQFGVRGFVGVEYFILPKMSLGGEFGWGIGISTTGAGQTTTEAIYTGTSPSTQTAKTGTSSTFNIGTDNKNSMFGPTGSIRANFYF
jgi:hypothetical protein